MYFLVLTLIVNIHVCLNGQSTVPPLEQVLNEINDGNTPEEKCKLALEKSHTYFMYMKRDESMKVTQIGLQIAQKNDLNEFEVPLLIYLGRLYESKDKLDSAIYFADLARQKLTEKSKEHTGKVYSFLGRHYQYFGELDSMLKYYTLAEDWNAKNEPYRNWVLYEQWHNLYKKTGDFEKAKELLDKAYSITKPVGKTMDHGMLLYRYRMLASRMGDMDMFAQYSKEYYDFVKDKPNKGMSAHGFDLGADLSVKDKIKKYEDLFESNKRIAFDFGNQAYYSSITELLLKDGQVQKAKKYWSKIDTTNQDLQFKSDFEDIGIRIFEKIGQYKVAFNHLKNKNNIDKQLLNREKLKQVEEFNVKYETIQKEKQVAVLESQNELKSLALAKADQSKYILIIGLIGTLIFASGLSYLYFLNVKKKKELELKNQIIETALEDKNILLREIHHRVKNNLQVVSSLLNLQANFISDTAALEAITEGKNRVSSMALIHQNLYQEDNLTNINSKEYFDDLIENLFESYNIDEENIILVKEIDDLDIDVDTMIPLGLIVNELVSNALKHAFKNVGHKGMITVKLKEIDNTLKLSIADNGVGMSKEHFLSSDSFGNKMIKAFKQKLDADIIVENKQGTKVSIHIKNYKLIAA